MKKFFNIFMIALMAAMVTVACEENDSPEPEQQEEEQQEEVTFESVEEAMFLRGAVNAEAWDNPQEGTLVANNTWEMVSGLELVAGTTYEYKFANTNDWSGVDWGGGEGASGTVVDASGGGANCTFTPEENGKYVFTFNDSDLSFTITKQ